METIDKTKSLLTDVLEKLMPIAVYGDFPNYQIRHKGHQQFIKNITKSNTIEDIKDSSFQYLEYLIEQYKTHSKNNELPTVFIVDHEFINIPTFKLIIDLQKKTTQTIYC